MPGRVTAVATTMEEWEKHTAWPLEETKRKCKSMANEEDFQKASSKILETCAYVRCAKCSAFLPKTMGTPAAEIMALCSHRIGFPGAAPSTASRCPEAMEISDLAIRHTSPSSTGPRRGRGAPSEGG